MIVINIDGGCYKNPGGIATYGVVCDTPLFCTRQCGVVGEGPFMSNNVSEYYALEAALIWLFGHDTDEDVLIKSDSALLVNQMQGKWSITPGKLYYPYYKRTIELMHNGRGKFRGEIKFELIPRELNTEADALSTQAREEYLVTGKKE